MAAPAQAQAILFELTGPTSSEQFGQAVAGVGDLDFDGYPDFAVGSPPDPTVDTNAGKVTLDSGLDASVMDTLFGSGHGFRFGTSIAAAGDVNADGYPDVIVGEPHPNVFGRARVFSGADRGVLLTLDGTWMDDRFGISVAGMRVKGQPDGQFGISFASGGDFDGDGADDLVIVSGGIDNGDVTTVGGIVVSRFPDGAPLRGDEHDDGPGMVVAAVGDVNLDGIDDFMVGTASNGLGKIVAGSTWYFQFWFRDPFAGMSGFNLSDGLAVIFCE